MLLTNYPILKIIILAISLLLIFRLVSYIFDKFINIILVKQRAKKALFTLELIVWLIFIYKIAEKSLSTQPVLSLIMILLLVSVVLWSFWFVLRDLLAGIILKISNRFKLNETIAFNNSSNGLQTIKGKIIRFTNQNLVLELQNLTIIEVPYNKLFNKKIERHVQSDEEELTLVFELKSLKDKEQFTQEINKKLFELPWINHKQEAIIVLQKQQDDKNFIELKVILLDKKYRNKVEEVLMKNFGK